MEEIYLSGRELGQLINTPIRTIENWAAAGKIAQNDKGKYGLQSAYQYQLKDLQSKIEDLKEEKGQLITKLQERSKEARERKLIAEADKEEALARIKNMEANKMEGKLVDADEVLNAWQTMIANAKAKFIGIPAKLALELSGLNNPEDIKVRLTEVIDEALIELGED